MNFKDVTRGGQATLHSIRMFLQVIRKIILATVITNIAAFFILVIIIIPSHDIYIGKKFIEATLATYTNIKEIELRQEDKIVHINSEALLKNKLITNWKARTLNNLLFALAISAIFSLVVAILIGWFFNAQSKKVSNKKFLRGAKYLAAKNLTKAIRKYNKEFGENPCTLYFNELPLPYEAETQHIIMYGAPGSGKTVALNNLLMQIRAQGFKTIVYDIEGSFIPKYYRPGHDIILNPLDERSPSWNLWKEATISADFDDIAAAIIPSSASNLDSFWNQAAKALFSVAAQTFAKNPNPTIHNFLAELFVSSPEKIELLLRGTIAQPIIEKDAEKTAKSIILTLSTYCKNLFYLNDNGIDSSFSIKEWLHQKDDSWLFISTSEQYQAAFSPIMNMWLDIAISSFLSLPESREQRTFFIVDEFTSLGKQQRMRSFLERARKRGGAFIGALQDFSQLIETYGIATAKSIQAQIGTTLFFRLNNTDSAKKAAMHLGSEEFVQANEGISVGAHEMRDGVNVNNQTRTELLIMPSEIMAQPQRYAYLKLAGNWPATQIKFPIQHIKNIAPSFVPKINNELFTKQVESIASSTEIKVSELTI